MKTERYAIKKAFLYGGFASFLLITLYLIIISWANSFAHAIEQFKEMWILMSLLIVGFGVQIGLYVYSKNMLRLRSGSVVVSSSVSATSMVACCAHHLTDVVPLLGISAATLFVSKYQTLFLLLGVLSNIGGIMFMLSMMQRQGSYVEDGLLSKLFKFDLRKFVLIFTFLSMTIFFLYLAKILGWIM
jgi:hypothetical protein